MPLYSLINNSIGNDSGRSSRDPVDVVVVVVVEIQ